MATTFRPESLVTVLALLAASAVLAADTTDSASFSPIARPVGAALVIDVADIDTVRPRRRRSVQISEGYATRLKIHRIGSYTMLPLFATQYVLGNKMLDTREAQTHGSPEPVSSGVRNAHIATGIGIGTLFTVNTVTGLWNLYESRTQPEGRTLRTVHALLMIASDAGFVTTGLIAENARNGSLDDARRHRNVALISMAPATVGAGMMWINHLRNR